MELESIGDVIRAGMAYERARVEAASYNLAIANVALRPGDAAALRRPALPHSFSQQLGLPSGGESQAVTTRQVLDPDHPLADERGMVHYPKIDAATEMATLVSATRAYEADIRAYNSLRAMRLKAFEIGK